MRTITDQVTVAVPPEDLGRAQDICGSTPSSSRARDPATDIVPLDGPGAAPWVMLHDIVHPFVTPALARRVLETARVRGASVAAVRSTSSAYHGDATGTAPRSPAGDLWLTRKPWAFRRDDFARGLASPGTARRASAAS